MNSKTTTLAWPYRLALLAMIAAVALASMGPRSTLRQLARAVENNDADELAQLVDTRQIQEAAKKLLDLQLRMQWHTDKAKSPLMAAKDYWTAKIQLNDHVEALASPRGFPAYLRGELDKTGSVDSAAAAQWIGEAALHWQSPTTVYAELANPDTGWSTRLVLTRDGLFHWRIDAVVLPAEKMLDRFAGQLNTSQNKSDDTRAPHRAPIRPPRTL